MSDGDTEVLESWPRLTTIKAGLEQRARIILLATDGVANPNIAETTGT